MRPQKLRLLEKVLGGAQWCLVVAAAWVLLKATVLRESLPQPALASTSEATDAAPAAKSETPDALAAIWQRDLQQELIPKPPEKKPEPKPPPPPPPVHLPKLLATFVENGQAWGLFMELSGAQRVRASGDSVDGFTIADISPGQATLHQSGQTYDIQIPRPQPEASRKLTTRRN